MPYITDLCVAYGASLAPSGFHRLTLPDGGQAELNKGCGGASTFLWYSNKTDKSPICDIILLFDEDACPNGFEKLSRNILNDCKPTPTSIDSSVGHDRSVYLCIKRRGDNDGGDSTPCVINLEIRFDTKPELDVNGKWFCIICVLCD